MYKYFKFSKNELILYHYLSELGNGDYELIPVKFVNLGMSRSGFYTGRDELEKNGYIRKIATNYYHFEKEGIT